MKTPEHNIVSRVWIWQGDSSWHFITIEKEDAVEIKKDWPWPRRGFGAIPVHVTLGKTTWKTSIFPEKDKTFILPLKKAVREQENVSVGDTITCLLQVVG